MAKNLINYWSYSGMCSFLSNPAEFRRNYILGIYDNPSRPSGVVGKACHSALEKYYKDGLSPDQAIDVGMDEINNTADMSIEFGKTGSRKQIIDNYMQAMRFFFEEEPSFHEILEIEEGEVVEAVDLKGNPLPLPLKSKKDIVYRNKLGDIEIGDWKFVKAYTKDTDTVDFRKFIQAMFYYHSVVAKYGEKPKRIVYYETKISKNKESTPQLQTYTFEFDGPNRELHFEAFYRLYSYCTANLHLEGLKFLPNPNDIYGGQFSFEMFLQAIDEVDAPVPVRHKTEQVTYIDKKYVPSALDRVENVHLVPEEKIKAKLSDLGIPVEMDSTQVGPSITLYTLKPSRGISASRIKSAANDIALAISAKSIRVLAPLRGTNLIGIEVPSEVRTTVELGENHLIHNTLNIPVGVDVYGKTVHADISQMPHLLIAGQTGSGKSVMLNVIIQSITKQMTADQLQLVLVDPKEVELGIYANLPHLINEIITDYKGAVEALDNLVKTMDKRYKMLARRKCRSIDEYNAKPGKKLPKIVAIIDEFADLMMTAEDATSIASIDIATLTENLHYAVESGRSGKITQKAMREAIKATLEDGVPHAEHSIIRIAQKARAVGIHLILATQRPSAQVVTGMIKANIPTKIAFSTTSGINSKIIIDQTGAEELTGRGDMLFAPTTGEIQRLQGLFAEGDVL